MFQHIHCTFPNGAARRVTPEALVDMVVARPWAIVDLSPASRRPAPYALVAARPKDMIVAADDRNIALLVDDRDRASVVALRLLAERFPYDIAYASRTEWLAYWDAVDKGVN
jgi:hypothetical protein